MQFDTANFLKSKFGNAPGLVSFFAAYGVVLPLATAEKWFYRASIPSSWLPIILAYVELDDGAPVSLTQYLKAAE